MKIFHISSEMAPIVKIGGMADMIYGLVKASLSQSHQISVILPMYNLISSHPIKKELSLYKEFFLPSFPQIEKILVWKTNFEGAVLYFIDIPGFFPVVYGGEETLRFLLFSCAVAEFLIQFSLQVDIIHLHDWPTAFVASMLKIFYKSNLRIIFTLHNMQHQGLCNPQDFVHLGIDNNFFLPFVILQDASHPELFNLLQGGIIYADLLTTVSPTYAKEIQCNQGFGLASLIHAKQNKLYGILNGIDYEFWNPSKDPFLAKNYSPLSLQQVLKGKSSNRLHLSKKLQLTQKNAPLFTAITRLVYQKGPDLLLHAITYVKQKGGQFVLLGSSPESPYESSFIALQKQLQDDPNIHFCLSLDEPLSHLLYAAADFIVIPSLFEPCGLTQMIALHFGCIPIVRKTGGLGDTIKEEENGIVFSEFTLSSLENAIDKAFLLYNKKDSLHKIMKNGLRQDFSWKSSALAYQQLYENIDKISL